MDYFTFFTILNMLPYMCIQVLCKHIFSFLLGRFLGVEFRDHMISLCLGFQCYAKLFSRVSVAFYILTSNIRGSEFLHAVVNSCCLFDDSHSSE